MTTYAITDTRTRSSGITTISVDLTDVPAVPHGKGNFAPTSARVSISPDGRYAGAEVTGDAGGERISVNVLSLESAPQFFRDLVPDLIAQWAAWNTDVTR